MLVELEVEEDAVTIKEIYDELTRMFKFTAGLPHLEWNKVLDSYLVKGEITPTEYESLGSFQTYMIQELKKSFKRTGHATEDVNIV